MIMIRIVTVLLCCFTIMLGMDASGSPDSRVDPAVLKAVVKVTSLGPQGTRFLGTGFLVSRPSNSGRPDERRFYLVTNKHIIGDWSLYDDNIGRYYQGLEIAFYGDPGSPIKPVSLPVLTAAGVPDLTVVRLHPNPRVDVAVVALTAATLRFQPSTQTTFDPSYMLAFDKISSYLTGLGDQVFALGYPRGITSLTTSYPIAKAGYLATEPGRLFAIQLTGKNRAGQQVQRQLEGKILVVDGLLVPGNSGGPVVLPSELKVRRDPQTNQLQFATQQLKNYVIGIVSTGLDNSGLTLVYSVDYIVEVLDQFEKVPSVGK